MGRRRHDRPRQSRRDLTTMLFAEVRGRRRARIRPDTGDLPPLPGARDVDEDPPHPRDPDHVSVDDTERHAGGDTGIDRVSTGREHARAGFRGQIVAGGHRPSGTDPLGRRGRSVSGRFRLGARGVKAHSGAIILAGPVPAKGAIVLRWGTMNPLPLIAVSTSVTVDKYPERAYVNASYLNAVQQAGGVPVPLPPQLESGARAEILKHVHGVLLTGGGDVDPARFGEPPHPTTAEVSTARHHPEAALAGLG